MNNEIEKIFIDSFVLKNRRERSLFELGSQNKRGSFFNKLCHRYNDLIDSKKTTKIPEPNSDSSVILKLLINQGAEKDCYIMSSFNEIDGLSLPLKEALDKCVGRGVPSIIICNPSKLAYFEAEQEIGPPPRLLLKNDHRTTAFSGSRPKSGRSR